VRVEQAASIATPPRTAAAEHRKTDDMGAGFKESVAEQKRLGRFATENISAV